jgi:hypothetical protein
MPQGSASSSRRVHYKVERIQDSGDGKGLEQHLEEMSEHAWEAVHFERVSDGGWIVVYEQPAVTPRSR